MVRPVSQRAYRTPRQPREYHHWSNHFGGVATYVDKTCKFLVAQITKLFPLLWESPVSLRTLIILGNEVLMSIPMDFYNNSFLKVQTLN
jgi:hypothetical protein